jgi:CBS domain-containing protein
MKTISDFLKMKGCSLWFVESDSSVKNAIKFMDDKQAEAMPVLEAGHLVGIISEKDCIKNVIMKGKLAQETQVREIMEHKIIFATPDQTAEDCYDLMIEKHLRYLPVIADSSLVGFFSLSDLINLIIIDQKDYISRLENYVMGAGFI